MSWGQYYNEALNFLASGRYAENCTNISQNKGGGEVLGHWGIAAAIYASVKCIFD